LYFSFDDLWDSGGKKRKDTVMKNVMDFFTTKSNEYGFEDRVGQQDMAFDIAEAIRDEQHLLIEAGVGIGKSYAYIVPLLYLHKASVYPSPIIISTSTIALQEQLMGDIKSIAEKINHSIEIVLAKGQTHFLCLKRADSYLNKHKELSLIDQQIRQGCIERKDFGVNMSEAVWEKINVKDYNYRDCTEVCPHNRECYFLKLRKSMNDTKGIVLCNHDLLTVHLQKVQSYHQTSLLPNNVSFIVVDEAHNLEEKVRSALTTSYRRKHIINTISEARKAIRDIGVDLHGQIQMLSDQLDVLYNLLEKQINEQISKDPKRLQDSDRFYVYFDRDGIPDISKQTSDLISDISDTISFSYYDESRIGASIKRAINELDEINDVFSDFGNTEHRNLYWLERNGRSAEQISLCSCPKNVNDFIERLYFSGDHKCILTSATITNQPFGTEEEQYGYFIKNTNFPTDNKGFISTPQLSPFPYDRHAMIYYSENLPHPTHERDEFIIQGTEEICKLLEITNGKALILFTSKYDLNEVNKLLKAKKLPYSIYTQTVGASQDQVLSSFRDDTHSVLLGTGSFWEGINIEGESLSNLIIFKLPFPVPDPIIDHKRSLTKNPMMDVSAPEMIIHLKQGVGRLIRNYTDFGIVSIIDPRLGGRFDTPYKDLVWEALPIKNRTNDIYILKKFYTSLVTMELDAI